MLDVLLVGRILPKKATIMAKSELKFAPILGQWSELEDLSALMYSDALWSCIYR